MPGSTVSGMMQPTCQACMSPGVLYARDFLHQQQNEIINIMIGIIYEAVLFEIYKIHRRRNRGEGGKGAMAPHQADRG